MDSDRDSITRDVSESGGWAFITVPSDWRGGTATVVLTEEGDDDQSTTPWTESPDDVCRRCGRERRELGADEQLCIETMYENRRNEWMCDTCHENRLAPPREPDTD